MQAPLQDQAGLGRPLRGKAGGEARPQRGAPACRHPGPPHQYSGPHPAACPPGFRPMTELQLPACFASTARAHQPAHFREAGRARSGGGAEPGGGGAREEVARGRSWSVLGISLESSPFSDGFVIIFRSSLLILKNIVVVLTGPWPQRASGSYRDLPFRLWSREGYPAAETPGWTLALTECVLLDRLLNPSGSEVSHLERAVVQRVSQGWI